MNKNFIKNRNEIKTVGIVAMPIISVGGGFARVTIDLINALNSMGKEVSLLTPFKPNLKKITGLYGPVKINKVYCTNRLKSNFCREDMLGRKLMKSEFQRMALEVDFIIDMDGGVLHNYLPESFNKNNYVIWRVSCINPETHKLQKVRNIKISIKKLIRRFVFNKRDIPINTRIYPLDEWTKKELISFWHVKPEKSCLYPEIKVGDFNPNMKKKNQIVIFGRIAPNKSIADSIKIFYKGTKDFKNYNLIILGGTTPDTNAYQRELNKLVDGLDISNRVKIIPNPSFNQIRDILSESIILIDSQMGVSLTMTAIEAMASGCIVIARKNGGTFQEILGKGKYGLGFDTIEDGGQILNKLLKSKGQDNKESLKRSKFFSPDRFKERLKEIINE